MSAFSSRVVTTTRNVVVGKAAEAANHVTGSYVIDVERSDGRVSPLHIRERIRALGPTVGDFAATV